MTIALCKYLRYLRKGEIAGPNTINPIVDLLQHMRSLSQYLSIEQDDATGGLAYNYLPGGGASGVALCRQLRKLRKGEIAGPDTVNPIIRLLRNIRSRSGNIAVAQNDATGGLDFDFWRAGGASGVALCKYLRYLQEGEIAGPDTVNPIIRLLRNLRSLSP
jgi:hypothetical protein